MQKNDFGLRILEEAISEWRGLAAFRRSRERNKNYTFGRQWEDMITVNGRRMTENEYILSEGHIPLKNNLIRRIVRNVLGVFRRSLAERMEEWGEDLGKVAAANDMYELFSRSMEEFLISGMAVHKKWVGEKNGKKGIWTEPVSPSSFFFDSAARDSAGKDFSLAGEIHHVGFNDFCESFVSTPREYAVARRLYGGGRKRRLKVMEIWRRERRPYRIVHDPEKGCCFRIEVEEWARSEHLHHLPNRWAMIEVWRYYFVTGAGEILRSGDSPYPHGSHPYVFKAYPFLDGEIHSLVEDTIDQQRYTNRLITMYDWVIRSSAKGVLLIPKGSVDAQHIQEMADQWSRFNGVIVYNPRPGEPDPRQITGNAGNMAISELLNIQLKMMEDVSGVNGALQGNLSGNSMSGTLYTQQTQNALTSLSDILDSFASFIARSADTDTLLLQSLGRTNPAYPRF
ncbi:MAG: hypothetical protein K2K64_08695 [Muribaculaceae bacterium]|nr:hypothetical protein [Muribaculaceae bacterium]